MNLIQKLGLWVIWNTEAISEAGALEQLSYFRSWSFGSFGVIKLIQKLGFRVVWSNEAISEAGVWVVWSNEAISEGWGFGSFGKMKLLQKLGVLGPLE